MITAAVSAIVVALLALAPATSRAQAVRTDSISIQIEEFEFDGKSYNRVVIANDPSKLDLEYRRKEMGFAVTMSYYQRFLLERLQQAVIDENKARGHLKDPQGKDNDLYRALTEYSEPQMERAPDEPPMFTPRTKIDDFIDRKSWVIFVTEKNDLSKILASVKVVETTGSRLFYYDRPTSSYLETVVRAGITDKRKAEGKADYEIENLFNVRGKLDFTELLIETITDLKILDRPNTYAYSVSSNMMRGPYESMGFWPMMQMGETFYLAMDGVDFTKNLSLYFSGHMHHQDPKGDRQSSDRYVKMAKIFQAHRQRMTHVRKKDIRPRAVDFSKVFVSLDQAVKDMDSRPDKRAPPFIRSTARPACKVAMGAEPPLPFY